MCFSMRRFWAPQTLTHSEISQISGILEEQRVWKVFLTNEYTKPHLFYNNILLIKSVYYFSVELLLIDNFNYHILYWDSGNSPLEFLLSCTFKSFSCHSSNGFGTVCVLRSWYNFYSPLQITLGAIENKQGNISDIILNTSKRSSHFFRCKTFWGEMGKWLVHLISTEDKSKQPNN